MTTPSTSPLNAGQQAAADGFFEFLFKDKQNELIISGPGGVGKTFLMGYLIDVVMPRYHDACKLTGLRPEYDDVVMTATTNKAAEVLSLATGRPAQTIHSLLNLTITEDFKTGTTSLKKTSNWVVHERKIIFVDEDSMIDSQLLKIIREGTAKCKIVFVGDHCQLAPVKEAISPIFVQTPPLPFYELTQPMRNSDRPDLMNICQQLRNTVETGVFNPIMVCPGVIDHFDGDQMYVEIQSKFINKDADSRILAYTNARVHEYNQYIRELRNLYQTYELGEVLINNNAVKLSSAMLRVEEEVEIIRLNSEPEEYELYDGNTILIRRADLETSLGNVHLNVPLPEDRNHFSQMLKWYASEKKWKLFYDLKNYFPDLRPREAATVHKAQGSTYDTVFIDMNNISTCRNPDVAARMLYVAFTRAKNRVIMYGTLVEKFGGIQYM